jgi:hypothetical protein
MTFSKRSPPVPLTAREPRSVSCRPLFAVGAILLCVSACAPPPTRFKMTENFDTEALGAIPLQSPSPSPPFDSVIWTQQTLTPTVVARSSGGRWVSVRTKPNYFPRANSQALSAFSDFFSVPRNPIRGGLSVRLVGPGHVVIALHAAQGPTSTRGGPLGGVSLRSGPLAGADIASLTDADLLAREEPFGTGLAPYTPGQTIQVLWSIDQGGGLLNLIVGAGNTRQLSIGPSLDGVAKFPLQRVFITITAFGFSQATELLVDDLSVEEL